ncbi:MAG: hypothetical protein PHE29_00925 [Tissierellia bacterium]|jgi:glycosyltransferase involved in cell wall biosynthesis|nr:hypothetical protein [Tissierellia bacterium]
MNNLQDKRLLILGKIPPPIGGVTIHVQRLLFSLKNKIEYDFLKLNFKNLLKIPLVIIHYKTVHLHSSNPWVRLYIVLISRLFAVKLVSTIHGNLGRFSSDLKNQIDLVSIQLSYKPILLNENSLNIARTKNKRSELISAFIPPDLDQEFLPEIVLQNILDFKKKSKVLFCTNAYNLSYDKNSVEIYGIFELIEAFRNKPEFGLVFSDPSGVYSKTFNSKFIKIPNNVLIINIAHSFYKVMQVCDASIRNTTTDGDSLSVKESLYLKRYTFATDAVNRPPGCILYKRGKFNDFLNKEIPHIMNHKVKSIEIKNGSVRLLEIYKELLNS